MSSGASWDTKDQVRQAVDIVDLVGSYLPLRREGRGYKALCPWHDDSRPSLQVNPERQSFRCWVCDVGGDIFSFMMKMEGVAFPEALSMLAERAGIVLERSGSESDHEHKRLLFQVMAWAEQQYHDCLLSNPAGQIARNYLAERQISPESIARFRLGASPEEWDWLLRQARATRFTPELLEQAGLVVRRSEGSGHYDRFRGRVLFSIRDPQSRPVGLGGRVLPGLSDSSPAKYINSPETPLFAKSHLLYGLDLARETLSKSRVAVVMEGYTDVVMAHQCGFSGAVAVLGTALNERHIRLLKRYVDRIVLVLDGDEAGRRRTDEVLELFIAADADMRILTLPDELDPAEFLLAHGATAFTELLDSAVDCVEHRFQTLVGGLSAESEIHTVHRGVEGILRTLAKAKLPAGLAGSSQRLKEEQLLNRLGRKVGLSEEALRRRLAEMRAGNASRPARPEPARIDTAPAPSPVRSVRPPASPRRVTAERWLLEILFAHPEWFAETRERLTQIDWTCPQRRTLFERADALSRVGQLPTFERLLLACDEPELKSLLVTLDEEQQAKHRGDVERELRDLLELFQDDLAERPVPHPSTSPPEPWSADDLQQLLERKRSRSRQGISSSTEGLGP